MILTWGGKEDNSTHTVRGKQEEINRGESCKSEWEKAIGRSKEMEGGNWHGGEEGMKQRTTHQSH